jgi:hypothetical protein
MDSENWAWLSRVTSVVPPQKFPADYSNSDVHDTAASDTLEAIGNQSVLDRDAAVSRDAERLADDILKADRALFGLESEVQEAPLREALEEALENAPYERVLLALCHTRDIDEIIDMTETMPDQPIEADEEGFAEITAALVALCANVARSRRILRDNETIDGRRIESMVRTHWKGPPYAPSSQVVPEMIASFGRVFVTADDERLRGFLDLPARMADPPVSMRPENRIVAAPPGDVSPDALRAAAALWTSACAEAQQELRMVRKAVDAWVERLAARGVEIDGGSWAGVHAIFDAVLEHPLDADIMATEGQPTEGKIRSVAEIRTRIGNKLEQLGSDKGLSLLDDFQLLNGATSFRSIFEGALVAMKDLMVPRVGG